MECDRFRINLRDLNFPVFHIHPFEIIHYLTWLSQPPTQMMAINRLSSHKQTPIGIFAENSSKQLNEPNYRTCHRTGPTGSTGSHPQLFNTVRQTETFINSGQENRHSHSEQTTDHPMCAPAISLSPPPDFPTHLRIAEPFRPGQASIFHKCTGRNARPLSVRHGRTA